MFTRFYYIIYKGINPIIELGVQVVADLRKLYQKNLRIENSIAKYNAFESNALKIR